MKSKEIGSPVTSIDTIVLARAMVITDFTGDVHEDAACRYRAEVSADARVSQYINQTVDGRLRNTIKL